MQKFCVTSPFSSCSVPTGATARCQVVQCGRPASCLGDAGLTVRLLPCWGKCQDDICYVSAVRARVTMSCHKCALGFTKMFLHPLKWSLRFFILTHLFSNVNSSFPAYEKPGQVSYLLNARLHLICRGLLWGFVLFLTSTGGRALPGCASTPSSAWEGLCNKHLRSQKAGPTYLSGHLFPLREVFSVLLDF